MKQFDVTVKQWQLIQSIVENEDNELLRWLDIMPILTDKTRDHYRQMIVTDFLNLTIPYRAMFETKADTTLPSKWEHDGRVFVCDVRLQKITGGQFIDACELGKDDAPAVEKMHKMLAIFWREQGKSHAEDFEERATFIQEHMPMHTALPTYTHFFQLWIESLPAIQAYLSKKAAGIGSPIGGGGTPRSTGWRRVTGKIGTTLRKWVSLSSLTTWRTSRTKAKGKSR